MVSQQYPAGSNNIDRSLMAFTPDIFSGVRHTQSTRRDKTQFHSNRSNQYEAVTLKYSKAKLMNKMLNPRRGFHTSKITDFEEEEFPLYTDGNDSMFGNSEMRSLMSGR